MSSLHSLNRLQGLGKRSMARIVRRILPKLTIKLTHVEPGVRLTVSLKRHVMFWSKGLAQFEPSSVKAIQAATSEGDHVLDVGANIGFFSTLLSRWVGEHGRVLAVEPEVENRRFLRLNLESNGCGNVTVCECAVSDAAGIAAFSIDEATGATGRLGSDLTASERAVGTGKLQVVETPVETIDSLCETHHIEPALIKIDIEGDEVLALRGATRLLRSSRPVVIAEVSGSGGRQAIDLLAQEGYRLWDLESQAPVGPNDQPFMVVAIPAEVEQGERAKKLKKAVGIRD